MFAFSDSGVDFGTSGLDSRHNSNWVWKATGEPVSFTHWGRNEPNKDRDNPQLIIGRYEPFHWYVGVADFNSYPICEA